MAPCNIRHDEHTPEENRAALLAGFFTYAAKECPHRLPQLKLADVTATTSVQISDVFVDCPRALALAGPLGVLFFQGELPPDRCVWSAEILQYVPLEHHEFVSYRSEDDLDEFQLLIIDANSILERGREMFDQLKSWFLAGEDVSVEAIRKLAELSSESD